MTNMKVLISTGHLDRKGGIANYVNLLIEELQKKEVDVIFFPHGLSHKYHKKPLIPIAWLLQFFKFFIKINSDCIDLAHLNPSLCKGSTLRDFVFMNIAKKSDVPVLLFFRGWRWNLLEKIKTNNFLRSIFKKNLKKVDKILVLSRDFKDALVDMGIDERKIVVSTIMVEADKYEPKEKKFDKPYNILFCARMVEEKGPFELLEAIPLIQENYPKTEFIFMGDGPCLKDLKRKTYNMNVKNNIRFTGYKTGKEKNDWYKKSHIFLLPSYTEGFPNVFLEAMASGLPVIATPVGALKNVLKDGVNGYLLESVPPEPDEMAEEIKKLMNDPNKMNEISERNLQEAKSKYDVEVVGDQIKSIYKDILE